MTWEDKTTMVQLYNQDKQKELKEFILSHVEQFDAQAWDMFAMVSTIGIEIMKQDIPYWEKIWVHLKKFDCNELGMRAGIRISLIQTICEEELKLK